MFIYCLYKFFFFTDDITVVSHTHTQEGCSRVVTIITELTATLSWSPPSSNSPRKRSPNHGWVGSRGPQRSVCKHQPLLLAPLTHLSLYLTAQDLGAKHYLKKKSTERENKGVMRREGCKSISCLCCYDSRLCWHAMELALPSPLASGNPGDCVHIVCSMCVVAFCTYACSDNVQIKKLKCLL